MHNEEKEPKKTIFVGSKAEEYAHRINCHYQNRLDSKIRHYQIQKDVLLKTFRVERSAILQQKEEIDQRLEELRHAQESSRKSKDLKLFAKTKV